MSDGQVVIDIIADAARYEAAVRSIAKTTESTISAMGSSLASIGAGLTKSVALPVIGIGTAVVGTAVNFLSLRESAQTAFTTMLGSGEAASKMVGDLYKFAKTTPFKFDGMMQSAQQLISMGMAADKVIPTLTAVGDAAAASGKGQEGFARITEALGKMQAQGQVSLEDIWSLSDNGVQALQILANESGKSVDEMKKAISDGGVESEWAIAALADGIENGTEGIAGSTAKMGGLMGNLKSTFVGACDSMTSSIRNLGLAVVGEAGTADAASSKFLGTLTRGVQSITRLIDNVATKWTEAGLTIEPMASGLADGIGSMADKIAAMDPTKFECIAKTIAGLAIAGPILTILGKGLQAAAPLAEGFIGAFAPITGLASKVAGGLSDIAGKAAGFAASVVSSAIPAAETFTKSLAHGLIPQSVFDGAKQLSTDLAYGLRDSKADIANAFSGAKDAIASKFSGITDAVSSKLAPLTSRLSGLTSVFGESARNAANTFSDKLGLGLGKVGDVAKAGFGKAGEAAKAGLGKVASGVGTLAKGAAIATVSVGAVATGLMGLGLAAATGGVDLHEMANGVVDTMSQITESLPKMAEQASQILPVLVNQVVSNLPTFLGAIAQAFSAIIDILPSIMPTLVSGIAQLVEFLAITLLQFAPQLLEVGLLLFTQIIQALATIIPQLSAKLPEMIASIIETLVANLPLLIEAGIQLFCALIQALAEATPLIIEQLPVLIAAITTVLIENLPLLLQAGLTLFLAIVTALLQAAPQIISTLVGMLPQLASTVIGFLPQLGAAAGDLFGALAQAIPKIAGEVLSALGGLLGKLPGKVGEFVGRMVEAGGNLIKGLANGIADAGKWVADKIGSICNDALGAVKSFFGIASPAKLMIKMGRFITQGLARGIGDKAAEAVRSMRTMVERIGDAAQLDVPIIDIPVDFDVSDLPLPSGSGVDLGAFALEAALEHSGGSPSRINKDTVEGDGTSKIVDALTRLENRLDKLDRGLGRKISDNSPDEVTVANMRSMQRALGIV